MSSGYGYSGGRTRCFVFWQEFSKCYAGADEPSQCLAQKEDYMECLHKTKEIERAKEIKKTFVQNAGREGTNARKAAEKASTGVIINLGLVHEN